jgi:glycosyltransferase involved in cell wall biosynthesis
VPAYGVAHLLGEALRSLQAQTFADWEAIVIDDGAPDDVASAFAPFANDERFRLLMTDNKGLATARNRAIGEARAPFIALLDGDDLYEPRYLERMVPTIEADPAVGFVCCDAMVFGKDEHPPRRYSSIYPMRGEISLGRVLDRSFVVFVATMIRRSALEDVGGFDAGLEACEDLDVWIRLLSAGWKAAFVAEPLARYRRRRGSMSSSERRMAMASCVLYEKACRALQGRAEQAVAAREFKAHTQRLRWLDGEALILSGDVAGGLLRLGDAGERSLRWRLGLGMMRRAPRLAAFLLRLRACLPDRFGGRALSRFPS